MIKTLLITAILGCYSLSNTSINTTTPVAAQHLETRRPLSGITMIDAPTPPPPYVKSVQFQYNGASVGAKYKVESADGCTIYKYNGTAGTSFENVLGVMFKSDCGTTRTIDVYYNDNGSWVAYRQFTVNL